MTNEIVTAGPDRGRRRTALAAVGGGVVVALIAGGAVVVASSAYAGGSSTQSVTGLSTASGIPHAENGGPGERAAGGAGHWGMRSGIGLALHGIFVTARPGGGYQTVAVQRGVVTALSATSVTVKSEDGFSATYVIDSNTKFGGGPKSTTTTAPTWLKVGANIHLGATVSGSTSTAVRIGEHTDRGPGHPGTNPPAGTPQPGWGGPASDAPPTPEPSPPTSTS